MSYSRYFLTLVMMALLASCASIDKPDEGEPAQRDDVFRAWDTEDRKLSPAVNALIGQADTLITQQRLDDAEVVLNRALRIDNRSASVWSRLAWICLESGCVDRARDYVTRSNSLTQERALLDLNRLIYDEAGRKFDESGAR